jgi:hypothetical protein
MASLDLMNEPELIAELHRLADACDRLNPAVVRAAQRQRFGTDPDEVAWAAHDEQALVAGMNRLMDRRRAVEGHLLIRLGCS